jgi:hypothetical protein
MLSNRKSAIRTAVVLFSSVAVVGGSVFIGAAPASAAVSSIVTVTKLSVSKGATTATTPVLITGKGFTTWTPVAADIHFNASAVTVAPIVISDTQMAVVAPTGSGGTGNVVVTDGSSNTSATSTASAWTYIAPLALTAIGAGTLLNSLGGTVLPVTVATGFPASQVALDAAKVTATVGGVAAKVKWVSATTGTVAVPAGTPSASVVKICVLSNGVSDQALTGGSCSSIATYATVISKLSVTSAPLAGIAGAAALVITGKGFTGVNLTTGVLIGATALTCTVVAATADTKLSCNIPAKAYGAYSVIITPATATYGYTSTSAFAYTNV